MECLSRTLLKHRESLSSTSEERQKLVRAEGYIWEVEQEEEEEELRR